MKFGIQVIVTSTPGKGAELAEILSQASPVIVDLKGCEFYVVHHSVEDGAKVIITQVWDSKQSYQQAPSNAKVQKLIEKIKPLIVEVEQQMTQ